MVRDLSLDITTLEIALATLVPLALLAVVVALGRNAKRLAPLVVLSLLWGFATTYIIIYANDWWAATYGLSSLIVLGAPIFEEISKSFALPFISLSHRCQWFVDGAVLGLAAGTGFAIRENWLYLERVGPDEGIGLALARVSSTNLMHAGCTAIVGAAIVVTAGRAWYQRLGIGLGGLLVAITLHSSFNRLTEAEGGSALLITLTGVMVFAIAAGIVALGMPLSSRWVRQDLQSHGANASEQAALGGGSSVAELLDHFEARYGADAAEKAEKLVAVQREIAIGRNAGRASDAEIAALVEKADELRRGIGLFAMMWLRSHLPVDTANVGMWADLSHSVDDTPTELHEVDDAAPIASGMWARLGELAPSNDALQPGPSDDEV